VFQAQQVAHRRHRHARLQKDVQHKARRAAAILATAAAFAIASIMIVAEMVAQYLFILPAEKGGHEIYLYVYEIDGKFFGRVFRSDCYRTKPSFGKANVSDENILVQEYALLNGAEMFKSEKSVVDFVKERLSQHFGFD
jgi:hypothetical protein